MLLEFYDTLTAYVRGGERAVIKGDALRFAARSLGSKAPLNQRISVGSIIRVQKDANNVWQISQLPQVEAAFVSDNPQDGEIYSLIGGFDFNKNQFNHVTQAWRQPGSSFKPFIYSAALEKGFTPATIIDDAPLSFDAQQTGSEPWQPKNYEGTYDGPMRMRQALVESKNLVSIRILQAITPQYAQDYITKFGFDADKIPPYLTMALGAGLVTPMQSLAGYSVFANGGFKVEPYFISRVEDSKGNILSKANPIVAGKNALQIIDTPKCLYNGQHDARRYQTRYWHWCNGPGKARPCRQNWHYQRFGRCMVLWFSTDCGRNCMDGIRPASQSGQP